ncbi:TonB-dependent receptor [Sphingomonas crocodyli]|uniref:TonB-dependent receptor n=1 Tax=Sphingomonas crocodyli TaxID=1979270 RepID=UPI0013E386C3|nr:TonB-dependent receptor [Sphingomonas crocodyli]
MNRSSLAALLVAQCLAAPAFAQDADAPAEQADQSGFGDILVTARSREESLYDAPLSITSFSAKDISNANLRDITNLAQVAPGFFYTPQVTFSSSRLTPALRFRGMTIPRNDPLEQLGGIFVDGIYLFGGAQSLTFDDIQRVEVIKGPQSALFGRGTFSGAINFITREPSDTLRARAEAGIETRGTHNLSGSIEGPLFEGLSFRISGASNEKGAHFTATDGGELGRESTNVINAQLVWKPVEGLRLRLRHSEVWLDDSRNGTANLNPSRPELLNAPGRCIRGTAPFFCGALPNYSKLVPAAYSAATSLIPPAFAKSNSPNIILDILNNNKANPLVVNGLPFIEDTPHLDDAGLAGRFYRTSFETDYEFANDMSVHLTLSKSDMKSTTAQVSTDDNGNQYVVSTNILTDRSADFRLNSSPHGRFTWLVGANYFKQKSLGGPSGTGALISVLDATNRVSYTEPSVYTSQGDVEYYSGFFGLHYDVLEWAALDVEGRYQVDRATTSLGLPTADTSSYKNFLPRAIVTLKPNADLTLYGSWARGALRGTTNSNFTLYSPALQATISAIPGYTYDVPVETVDSFEVGVKQVLPGFRYALTGYYMDWKNLKNTVNTPCPSNRCGPTITGAFAAAVIPSQAKIWGLEAEFDLRIAEHWDASLNAQYTHARYDRLFTPLTLAPTGQTDASGKTPVGFPSKQASFSTTYRDGIASSFAGGDWEWYARGEANYTGRIYVDEINQSWLNDRLMLNMRLGIERGGTRFEIYSENLTNNKTWVSAVRGSATNYRVGTTSVSQPTAFAVLPRLRTFGVRVSYDF